MTMWLTENITFECTGSTFQIVCDVAVIVIKNTANVNKNIFFIMWFLSFIVFIYFVIKLRVSRAKLKDFTTNSFN